jgi:hypothetical protein
MPPLAKFLMYKGDSMMISRIRYPIDVIESNDA